MVKGRHLLSLPVMDYHTGEQLGEVRDIIYDPYHNKILGFLLEEGSWFWGARVLPFDRVYHVGEGAVTVASRDAVLDTAAHPAAKELVKNRVRITGCKLLSEKGNDLGTIQDLVLDPVRGKITGYEISGGLIGDLMEGRKIIPVPQTVALNDDALIITGAAEEAISSLVTGGDEDLVRKE